MLFPNFKKLCLEFTILKLNLVFFFLLIILLKTFCNFLLFVRSKEYPILYLFEYQPIDP